MTVPFEINCTCLSCYFRWVLGISPSGSNDLLSALKLIFESGNIFEEFAIEGTGSKFDK